MNKVKAIAIFVAAVIFVSMGIALKIYIQKYQQEKADRERLWSNNLQLFAENRQYIKLVYSKDEFIRVMSDSLRSALDSLKIKPKQVNKIVYRTITEKDTVVKEVPVVQTSYHTWLVSDTGKCFIWSGNVTILSEDSVNVKRTAFSYHNETADYFYQTRPHKFLFIRWGKKTIKQVTVPKCGTAREKVIEIIK
jgi:hypothetical protein